MRRKEASVSRSPTEPPFRQGDWITAAFHYRTLFAPPGQHVWQATATPVRSSLTGSGWAVFDSEGRLDATNFRLATREDIAAEVDRLTKAMSDMDERRLTLAAAGGVTL